MKKKSILFIFLLLFAANPVFAAKELFNSPEDLENIQEFFYEAPIIPGPEVKSNEPKNLTTPLKATPLFKKCRIKITNYFRTKDLRDAEKILENEKKEHAKLIKEEAVDSEVIDKNLDISPAETSQEEMSENKIELSGGVKEQVASNDALLDADNIDYDEETQNIIATGKPILVFPPQSVTLKADKMIYNNNSNILKAYGNVEVIRDDNVIKGDFIQVNMNEENSFMENVNSKKTYLTIKARSASSQQDKIILNRGKLVSEESHVINFHNRMIGGEIFNTMLIPEGEESSLADQLGNTAIKIQAEKVVVDAKKDHDVISLRDATICYGDHELFTIPSFTAHTNKKQEYFEANYPEFGSRTKLGMFIGPGFVFDIPNGAIVKVMPMLNYKDKIGFGGGLKYVSGTNRTEFMYGSANDIFVLRGKQQLDDKLLIQYGANSYMDEWWFGMRIPKYTAEIVYKDKVLVPNTIKEGLDLSFRHRASFGYMQDNDENRYGENIAINNIGTIRGKYMAELSQNLYHYIDPKNAIRFNIDAVLQGSAAVYGTGDTQFVGRVGPRFHTQYKHWMQEFGYFISGYQDNTPMPVFDAYRYGHSNVYIREAWRVNKYLTLAWAGSMTLTDDSLNGKLFQENSFIVSFGPDDLKLSVGYDVVRGQTYFAVNVYMDTKGSSLEYEKMEIKNPDKLAKSDEKEEKLITFDENTEMKPPVKKIYAEVIDIEDPDKEDI